MEENYKKKKGEGGTANAGGSKEINKSVPFIFLYLFCPLYFKLFGYLVICHCERSEAIWQNREEAKDKRWQMQAGVGK